MRAGQSKYGADRVHGGNGASLSPSGISAQSSRSLPKTESGLQRAADMNAQIAENYGRCDYSSPWVGYHTARAGACSKQIAEINIQGGIA